MSSSFISDAASRVHNMVAGEKGRKVADLDTVTQSVSPNDRVTSDFGVKMGNVDEWLRVASAEKTGPMLLEDSFSREMVSIPILVSYMHINGLDRFIDSIMSASPNESSMRGELALLETSGCSKAQKT